MLRWRSYTYKSAWDLSTLSICLALLKWPHSKIRNLQVEMQWPWYILAIPTVFVPILGAGTKKAMTHDLGAK